MDRGLSYDSLTDSQKAFFRKFVWNGLGSRDAHIDPHDLIFKNASIYHDWYYFVGGPDKLRIAADKEFLVNCNKLVLKERAWKRWFYYPVSYVYYFFIKIGSKLAWEYYDEPAQTWEEFIEHVMTYFDRKKKPYPWAGLVENPFTV